MKLTITVNDLRNLGITKASELNKTYEWITNQVRTGQVNNTPEDLINSVKAKYKDEITGKVLHL